MNIFYTFADAPFTPVYSKESNGLILFKHLFQESFSSTGSKWQQENWDWHPNFPVSTDFDMNPPAVFNGHVH